MAPLRIGLATVPNHPAFEDRLRTIDRFLTDAAAQGVAIVCFPETYLPGLRGFDFPVPPPDQPRQQAALERVRASAERTGVAVILGMEWQTELGLHNVAFVISRAGVVEGYQTKNQLPLEEEPYYVPDGKRRLFEVDGVPFGITICHEGWRYPEATRWAALRGAKIVFHPQMTGSDNSGPTLTRWGDPDAPYYEKAMLMRSIENTVYFASVNYALRYPESATSLIGPEGELLAHAPYREESLLVYELDTERATGLIAKRYQPDSYCD
ncbi:MAG: carbon-nitrogen hydrolase family protein [Bryobacterales bacterium]|nr:carbon-nitrogen hydrolase family protein [Acidobacteriota bacterium]MCB9385999.1 carbon-nitrogen hydrolase family protein [Bryobacterales bacterium]